MCNKKNRRVQTPSLSTSGSLPVHFRFTSSKLGPHLWTDEVSHNSILQKMEFRKIRGQTKTYGYTYVRKKVTSKDPFRVYAWDLKIEFLHIPNNSSVIFLIVFLIKLSCNLSFIFLLPFMKKIACSGIFLVTKIAT